MSDDIRELVTTSSRVLAAAGQDDLIWGHASARDPEGRGVWIKSAEWSLAEITPESVQLVDSEDRVVAGEGPRHSKYPIHTEILTLVRTSGAWCTPTRPTRSPSRPRDTSCGR